MGDLTIVRKKDQTTTQWAGGTTTQLFIYPAESEYAKRDFLFRISTATTEQESSTFTHLPGIKRILMVLKGKLTINHKNQNSKTLLPFESDSFDGDWETSAKGKVTDFNVLFKPEVKAQVSVEHLTALESKKITPIGNAHFGYLFNGRCELKTATQHYTIHEGDFVVFHELESTTINALLASSFILIEISVEQKK